MNHLQSCYSTSVHRVKVKLPLCLSPRSSRCIGNLKENFHWFCTSVTYGGQRQLYPLGMRSLCQLDGSFCGHQRHQDEVQKRNNLSCASDVNSTCSSSSQSISVDRTAGFPSKLTFSVRWTRSPGFESTDFSPMYFLLYCQSLHRFYTAISNFDVLTAHLSIFILVINQIDAQKFFFSKFYFMPLHVSSTMCSSSGGQSCIIQPLVSSHL